jgi:hypothetical protein
LLRRLIAYGLLVALVCVERINYQQSFQLEDLKRRLAVLHAEEKEFDLQINTPMVMKAEIIPGLNAPPQ